MLATDATDSAPTSGQPIGSIELLIGAAVAVAVDGRERVVVVGDALYEGEVVRVDGQSIVEIRLGDSSLQRLSGDGPSAAKLILAQNDIANAAVATDAAPALVELTEAVRQAVSENRSFTELLEQAPGETVAAVIAALPAEIAIKVIEGLPPAAAGGELSAGHTFVIIALDLPQPIPEAGFRTEGLSYSFPEGIGEDALPLLPGSLVSPVLPTFSINDVTVTEGNPNFETPGVFGVTAFNGTDFCEPSPDDVTITFTVTRTGTQQELSASSTVTYTVVPGSAVEGEYIGEGYGDYTAIDPLTGTLTFAAGESTQTITLRVTADCIAEPTETFTVVLSDPVDATITKPVGVGTILDNDGEPSYTIVKSVADVDGGGATATVDAAGDVITYEIVVTNTGNQSITGVMLSDPLLEGANGTLGAAVESGTADGTLSVGETFTYTGTYTVQQSDLDDNGGGDGDIDNTASVVSTQITTPLSDSEDVSIAAEPVYTIVKSVADVDGRGATASVVAAGDVITYEIVVENTGNQSITGVMLSDPLLEGANGTLGAAVESGTADGTLSVGETFTYTGTYTVQQSDLDDNGGGDGDIDNTASVVSTQITTPLSDSEDVSIAQGPLYTIVKSVTDVDGGGATASVVAAGDVITYEIVVENTGNQSITGVMLSDPLLEGANGTLGAAVESGTADGTLSVGETFTYTGTYTVQQSDLDDNGGGDGDIDNTASVVSTQITTPLSDSEDVSIAAEPVYTIVKSVTDVDGGGATASVVAAGDVITYEIVVENTGNQSITGVMLSDPLLEGANGTLGAAVESGTADGTLSVGETFTYTGTYTVQQSDLDDNGGGDGDIDNTASVVSTQITTPLSDSEDVSIAQGPLYTIVKSVTDVDGGGATASVDAAGDVITYEIVVENTGNQSITGVMLSDPLLEGANGTLGAAVESGTADGTLSVGETFTYTGTYTVQQSDLDDNGGGDGDIDNTASVVSTQITTPLSDSEDVSIAAEPVYTIVKSVADVDGRGATASVVAAGDVITYEIVVENTGNQSITGVMLSDPLLEGANGTLGAAVESGTADGTLSVGETFTYTGTYTVQQSDLDDNGGGDGDIDNTASVVSTQITTPLSDSEDVSIAQGPLYTIVKSVADVDGGGATATVDAAGDVITYEIVVTNTGNQSITGVMLSDPLLEGANGTLGAAVESGTADGTLSVGETFTYTGTYTVQQSDLDDNGGGDGDIDNTASVVSTQITTPLSDSEDVSIAAEPVYTIVKSVADVDGRGATASVVAAGDVITYEIVVENTGNQSITGVMLSDPLLEGANGTLGAAVESGTADGTLSVGETFTYTGTYTVQQSDLDDNGGGDGDIDNTASVVSTQITTPLSDSEDVSIAQGPLYTIVKSVTDVDGGGATASVVAAGDVITYQIVVENTGNQSITGVMLSDPLLEGANGTLGAAVESGTADGTLSVGETFTYTGTYTVQQSDLDDNGGGDGDIDNTASVVSTQITTPLSDSEDVSIAAEPVYTIVKSVTDVDGRGATASVVAAGDVITYEIVVENTGNQSITGVMLSDPLLEGANGTLGAAVESGTADGTLSVGETFTYTGTYTVQQSDLDDNGGGDGDIDNTASVVSTQITTPLSDSEDVSIAQGPLYTIVKSVTDVDGGGATASVDAAGDVITYEIVVENTGNQSITGVMLSDPLLEGANGTLGAAVESGTADGTLSVGETFTYTGTYTVQQSDLDDNGGGDGDIDNTASVVSTQITTPLSDSEDVSIAAEPVYTIVKSVADVDGRGATASVVAAGDVITYQIVVENTGNQSITGVMLSDPLLEGANGTLGAAVESGTADGTLSVGETFTYTGTYTVQQSDLDDNGGGDGDIDNTASVVSTQITTPLSDSEDVSIAAEPVYTIVKSVADVDGRGATASVVAAGDVITYQIVVENTGNQSITGVMLSDPLLEGANGTLGAAVESGTADGTLSVGETFTYTGTYTVQQSDLDDNGGGDGDIDNTASVVSTQITTPLSDSEDVSIAQGPLYTIVKSVADVDGRGATASVVAAGDVITYEIVVENTGNQSITGVMLSDPLLEGANGTLGAAVESGAADGTLSVGETFTYTGTYTVQQSDLDDNGGGDGDIDNTASVVSTQITTPLSDSEDVSIAQGPLYTIVKSVTDVDGRGATASVVAAGDVITYQIVVENTGNQSITGVMLSDPLLEGANGTLGAAVESGTADGTLSVGETFTYTGTYTVQQSDLDDNGGGDGDIDNTASVVSTQITTPLSDSEEVLIVPLEPAYTITKVLTDINDNVNDTEINAAGDVLTYTVTLVNDGNQAITGVVVGDALVGDVVGTPVQTGGPDTGAAILDVGETWTYTYDYTVLQSDIGSNATTEPDNLVSGKLDNKATVTSTQITLEQSDTEQVDVGPLLFISNSAATEGSPIQFFVGLLNGPASADVTVDYVVIEGVGPSGATTPADYGPGLDGLTGTLTFNPTGSATQTITLDTFPDPIPEGKEFFTVELSNVQGPATLARAEGEGTINDENLPGTPPTAAASSVADDARIFTVNEDSPVDQIAGFSQARGDVLDLADLIEYPPGESPTPDPLGDFVQIEMDGSDAIVSVDADGPMGGASFVEVAALLGVVTASPINTLVSDNHEAVAVAIA